MISVYQQQVLDIYPVVEKAIKDILMKTSVLKDFFVIDPGIYNPFRQQYNAMAIIDQIAKIPEKTDNERLLLVDVDIYVQGMNYVFGLADTRRRTALVSANRLDGEKVSERIIKETVHEIGHLNGLQHCSMPECVMYFSHTLQDTDHKQALFCPDCRSKYGQRL